MKITLTSRFDIGQVVYLKTDPDESGIVTGFMLRTENRYLVMVSWSDRSENSHYEFELLEDKPL